MHWRGAWTPRGFPSWCTPLPAIGATREQAAVFTALVPLARKLLWRRGRAEPAVSAAVAPVLETPCEITGRINESDNEGAARGRCARVRRRGRGRGAQRQHRRDVGLPVPGRVAERPGPGTAR